MRRFATIRGLAAALLACGAMAARPASSEEIVGDAGLTAGSLLVRGRIIGSVPYAVNSEIALIGGRLRMDPMLLPDADVTYFLTDHLAVTGTAGILRTRITAEKTLIGKLDIGHVWSVPVMATAHYHFRPEARLNPYLGAGAYASWYFGEQPAGGLVTAFKVPAQVGAVLVAGLDYQLGGRWYANAEMKQIFLPEQTYRSNGAAGARVSANVMVLGVGLGYRF